MRWQSRVNNEFPFNLLRFVMAERILIDTERLSPTERASSWDHTHSLESQSVSQDGAGFGDELREVLTFRTKQTEICQHP